MMFEEEIKNEFRSEMTKIIKRSCPYTRGRRNKFPIEFYLDAIFLVLFRGFTWNDLKYYTKDITPDAIRIKYTKWNNLGLFSRIHKIMLRRYNKEKPVKDLFMDSTILINQNCTENLGYCRKYKNKKTIKLNVIVDENKIPISHEFIKSNISDSQLIESTIDSSIVNINGTYRNPVYLTADKGYINGPVEKELKKRNILLNVPQRKQYTKNNKPAKNSTYKKKHLSSKKRKLLKERYVVEHGFNRLKKSFKRFGIIYDRTMSALEGWFNISASFMIFSILKKINNR